MPRSARRAATGALALAVLAVVAGCSNSDTAAGKRTHAGTATASAADGALEVTITTGTDLRFHPSTFVVPAHRKVKVVLKNTASPGSGPPHNLVLDGRSGGVPTTNAGQTQSYTFTTPSAGRYRFVCTFHVAQGQTGTMIVRG